MEKTIVNLPRSGRPSKIPPKAQRQLIQEVTKDWRTTSKELQASPASLKFTVQDPTTWKTRAKNGIHERVVKRKPLPTKKNIKEDQFFIVLYCSLRSTYNVIKIFTSKNIIIYK